MKSRLLLLCALLLTLAAPMAGDAAVPRQRAAGELAMLADLRVATLVADDKVQLPEILSGRARVGFDPVLRRGLGMVADPERTLWVRVRADLPAGTGEHFLVIPRQAIERIRVYRGGAPLLPIAESGLRRQGAERWPDAFVLPMPGDARGGDSNGGDTVFLAIKARGLINLQVELLDAGLVQARTAQARRSYLLLYGSLLLIGVLAVVRRWTGGEPGYLLAQAAFATLAAAMVDAFHLQFTIGGIPLAARPNLPAALWILAGAALMRATQQYAGHEKNTPAFAFALERASWGVAALAIAALFVPAAWLPQLQVAGLVILGLVALLCCGSLFLDPRHWRWTPILAWLGVVLALAAIPLAFAQLLPQSLLVRRGFQLLLALLLASYLLLPWLRRALRERARLKRAVVVEPSAEEKIAEAREWLMSSLEAGMQSAAEADMEWIAYRRLMAGLKPVLPQTAAAVIAMNYHNEDLMLVEPAAAEERFRMLLSQRASLLKNLSRSLAPQQIVLDFDGPEGPLDHVMLAIIPLPIDRPGWGALVIERAKDASYSEAELDLCTEFAALATTAADEAAEAMQQRHVQEIDADSGAYRAAQFDLHLGRALDASIKKRKPVAVMRVAIDGFEQLPAEAAPSLARAVADTIREEIDFGETIVRRTADEFTVFVVGRAAGEVRALGERICNEMRRHPLPGSDGPLTVSVGVAQMLPGERSPQLTLERSAKALAKARSYGGNQAQMVSGSGP